MKKRKTVRFIAAGIGLIAIGFIVWSMVIEPNRLVVNEVRIPLPNWPAPLNGLKIVAIGDLHAGSNFITEEKIRRVVAVTNEQHPDVIVLLGDYVTGGEGVPPRMPPEIIAVNLQGLQAKYGVFAVLGNHDWWTDGPRMRKALESIGIRVLESEVAPIVVEGQTCWLMGVPDFSTHGDANLTAALAKINAPGPIIALTHEPDTFPELVKNPRTNGIAITLAAHTHGGQVNLPFVGRLIVPSLYGQRYAAGLIREGPHTLFVTTGIGTSVFPIRFRVPPEIAVLTLVSE